MNAKIRAFITCALCNIIFTYVANVAILIQKREMFEVWKYHKVKLFERYFNTLWNSHMHFNIVFLNSQIYRVYACLECTQDFLFSFFSKNRKMFSSPFLAFLWSSSHFSSFFSRSSKVNWIEKSGCMEAVHVITEKKKSTTVLVLV